MPHREGRSQRFERSEKLTDWGGWVYCEGTGRDGFSSDVFSLIDDCESRGIPVPEYAWACNAVRFAFITIDEIKCHIAEGDAYEDFDPEDLNGLPELEKAIDVFNELNSHIVSYQPDYGKSVLIQAEKSTP